MCGIIVTNKPNQRNLISHRGLPDYWDYRGVGSKDAVHFRLPIQTDLSSSGQQPIEIFHGKYLLFNGEIFNYPLEFSNDVEYLTDFFKKYSNYNQLINNPKALQEINTWDGFWSIVLVDADEMICFTDPLGKKQLYYDKDFNVCSEVKGLIDNNSIDHKTVSTIYKFGYNTDNRTMFNGIKRFLPNNIYCIRGFSSMTVYEDYFNWPKFTPGSVKELLYKSVERRLISKNFPVGLLLSGGLDSTIITSILKDLGALVSYYTIENGETEYVDICADYFGINIVKLPYPNMDDMLDEVLYYNDSPIDLGSLIPQHSIMSVIPEKIVLTGDGADELFGGYRRIDTYDSQKSDIFDELSFYHLPRLDRASMRYTIELRNPFLSHDLVRKSLTLKFEDRKNKAILKREFENQIPSAVLERVKQPLKRQEIITNPIEDREKLIKRFLQIYG